jgi:hypothetical protein
MDRRVREFHWIPAFSGMTKLKNRNYLEENGDRGGTTLLGIERGGIKYGDLIVCVRWIMPCIYNMDSQYNSKLISI